VSIDPQAQLAPSRIGQATAVEQSRAIAQVQAMVVVAQQCPRNVARAIEDMRASCRRKELADRAFFRFPKGGGVVSGESVHLARELARVWGNIEYGLSELRRDDDYGQSEMLAFAWDVQTNARCSSTFINPHQLYSGGRGVRLTELRDVYDNNANVGARRVREAIFAVLPAWFVEEAKAICARTLSDGGGKLLPQRIADAISTFGNYGITLAQLEAKLGLPSARWQDMDVAQLRVIHTSLMRGEIRKDEEFPPERAVTAADITGSGPAAASSDPGPAVPDGKAPGGPAAGPGPTPAPDAGGSGSTAAPATAQPARAERPDPDVFHTDAEAAALLAREGLRDEHERIRPDPTLAASGASGRSAGTGRGESQRTAAIARVTTLLRELPLGEEADVAALIRWLTGAEVTPELMTISQARTVSSFLADAYKAAGGDPEETVSQIWAQYRKVQDGKPGGTDAV
jgi:hypothetical protein